MTSFILIHSDSLDSSELLAAFETAGLGQPRDVHTVPDPAQASQSPSVQADVRRFWSSRLTGFGTASARHLDRQRGDIPPGVPATFAERIAALAHAARGRAGDSTEPQRAAADWLVRPALADTLAAGTEKMTGIVAVGGRETARTLCEAADASLVVANLPLVFAGTMPESEAQVWQLALKECFLNNPRYLSYRGAPLSIATCAAETFA